MLRRRWPVALFAVWSAYVWVTRIANAWAASSTETATAKSISTVTAVGLLALALGTAVVLVQARRRVFRDWEITLLRTFAGLTVVVWALRVPIIVADSGQGVPF